MKENLINQTIGIFTILYECKEKYCDGHKQYCVECNTCGAHFFKKLSDIKRTKKCTHSSNHWENKRITKIFLDMRSRCYDLNDKDYRWYGAKGTKICDEWLNNPMSFEKWALSNGYKDNLTIDRINSNKDYCPENCRWVTKSENSRRANANFLEVDNIKLSGSQWALYLNLPRPTINKLLRKYPEEQVKEFIRRRSKDLEKRPKKKQTWLNVYGLE